MTARVRFFSLTWITFAAAGGWACEPAPPPEAAGATAKDAPPPAEATETARGDQPPNDRPAREREPPAQEREPPRATPATDDGPRADSPLLHPERATGKAPERFDVVLDTTKGDIVVEVHRSWAPRGVDRFYNLVKIGYYDNTAFFRVIDGFMAQVGIHGNPEVNRAWRHRRIKDDPPKKSNTRGMVSFATSGPDSRVNQIFINYGDNSRLDAMGFAPFARVRNMEIADKLYAGYGEGAPRGRGPAQALLQNQGNAYLEKEFPALDYIKRAYVREAAEEERSQRAER